MKVLFIIGTDFPYSGSCTSLLKNLMNTEQFLFSEHQFSVLSLGNTTISQSFEKLNNVKINRTFLRRNIPIQECKKKILCNPWKVIQILLFKVWAKISRCILNQAINSVDIAETIHKLNEIDIDQYDILVPIFGELYIAAAALKIKKRYLQKKMVLYQVDPCSSNEEYSSSLRKQLADLEQELFRVSDKIITTEILLHEAQAKYTDEILCKMTAMEFPNVVPKPVVHHPDTDSYKRCVFTGCIYGNIRDPEYTYRLFYQLGSKIRLEMIGGFPAEERAKCEKYGIIAHGWKTLQETRDEIEKAHILVNIGNSMLNQVPSKLFEYISYGKPIVNICKNRNCPTLSYLARYPYVLNLFEEEGLLEEQRTKLTHFINQNYDKCVPFDIIQKEYEACTPQFCARQMISVFDELN